MPKLTRFERLNAAIESHALPPETELRALAQLAADLGDLPRQEFKQNLKDALTRKPMATLAPTSPKVKPIPEGYHAITPYLIVNDAAAALDFYKRAFGATELFRMNQPDGRIGHAEIRIGDSHIMLADEHSEIGARSPQHYGGTPVSILLYVEDVDAIFAQALAAGAKIDRPLEDQPYGDRNGGVVDPFGHRWFVATHIRDVEMTQPQPRPKAEMRAVTPYLQVDGADRLIEFMQRTFGAEARMRVPTPDGKVMHAEMAIGDSLVELADSGAEYKAMPTAIHLYVPDVDGVYERALAAGATSIHAPFDADYGERCASFRDPVGNHWYPAAAFGSSYVPEGLHTVTLYLHPATSEPVIEFLQQAFGAQELFRAQSPDGVVHHAKVKIGDSVIEMGDAHGDYQPMPAAVHLHVPDSDATFAQALAAGGTVFLPLKDAPYGERVGGVTDPFGNIWYIATYLK